MLKSTSSASKVLYSSCWQTLKDLHIGIAANTRVTQGKQCRNLTKQVGGERSQKADFGTEPSCK